MEPFFSEHSDLCTLVHLSLDTFTSLGHPKTLLEFERKFSTEEDCSTCLEYLRWPEGIECICGSKQGWRTGRGLWKCAACKKSLSVTAGTIFHGSHLPLTTWFRALWWMTGHQAGVSALSLQHALGIGSYRTAWGMLHAIRGAMGLRRRPLRGHIDVGIRSFSGTSSQAKRSQRQSFVGIAVEEHKKGVDRIRMRRLASKSAQELRRFLEDIVEPGSTVYADCEEIASLLLGWKYFCKPSPLEMQRAASRIQLTAVHIRRWIDGTHHGRYEHRYLQGYLDEFSFRFNRRNISHNESLFLQVLASALCAPCEGIPNCICQPLPATSKYKKQ